MFLDVVRAVDLPPPWVNVLVEGFLVDAHWPEARLVVELDGYAHHSDRDAFEHDHNKALRLRLAGFRLLAFTYRQVAERPSLVAEAIAAELASAHSGRAAAHRR
jgi:very-short-patch-repair endonuclease